ncbi:LexA family protein [Pseudomonas gingeri]|uniref:LexA family protein n=1 Tax=Pseudomonas gingeri TaxID=117681 RepID=UPI003CCCCB19
MSPFFCPLFFLSPFSSFFTRAPHVYLVSIEGDSMQGAGIFDGDLAVVDRPMEPLHGHIVVALLNNDPVCKRLCKQGPEVILKSENPRYPARYVMEGDELSIWGGNYLQYAH